MTDQTLTLQEAADAIGVHYMTAYRYVRLGKLMASKTGASWEVRQDDLQRFLETGGDEPAKKSTKSWGQDLQALLLKGDEPAARQLIESAMASGHTAEDVYRNLISPCLSRIGDMWHEGTIDVADEHVATLTATRLVGRLSHQFNRRGRPRGTIIVATPPTDFHGLAALMVGDLVRGAGYRTIDLGAAVPVTSLARTAAAANDLKAVAISAFKPENEGAIRAAIDAIRQETSVPIWLGGPAIDGPNHARGLGADLYASDITEALATLET